jgi:D-tyrosyl-tRNA(Tyr) deacylase
VGECGPGFLVYVGAGRDSTQAEAVKLADRVAGMRVINDADGKLNLSLADIPESGKPKVLVVSNFTLYGDAMTSRRPSFARAAGFEAGLRLYDVFVGALRARVPGVAMGEFGADMKVESLADGPVTMLLGL